MDSEILVCEKNDKLYPIRFLERKGLPERFYYKGDISFLNDFRSVAIIGSRNAPKEAILSAYASGQYAAMEGFAVANGLAVGCDTAALRGALSEGGRCVAVLPCGLDMVVPSVNEYLAQEILEKGGCLISEYAAGTEPEKYRYVQRDRLQSGLSEAVLIVYYGKLESRSDSFMSDLASNNTRHLTGQTSNQDAAQLRFSPKIVAKNRKDSGSLKTAEYARKQGVKVLSYKGAEGGEDDVLPFAETLADPEAFRSFLKNYVPGEAFVYEQMRLPFL